MGGNKSLLVKKWVLKNTSMPIEEWKEKVKDIRNFLIENHLYKFFFDNGESDNHWFSFVVSEEYLPKAEEYVKTKGFNVIDKRPMNIKNENGMTIQ